MISNHIFQFKCIIYLLLLFQGQTLRCLSSAAATTPKNPTNLARLLGAPLTVSIHFIYSEDVKMVSIIQLNIIKNYKILLQVIEFNGTGLKWLTQMW